MLLTAESSEIFSKHNEHGFISESFAMNWYIFVVVTNKKTVASIMIQT